MPFFLKKKDRLITILLLMNFFWIVTIQDWPKSSCANAYSPLGTTDFSNAVDMDNLLVENSKVYTAFLIINE